MLILYLAFMKYFISIFLLTLMLSCKQESNNSNTTKKSALNSKIVKVEDHSKENSNQEIKQDPNISIDYVMGKFNPTESKAFELIDPKYASRSGMYLRKEAYKAFKQMYEAALSDGIDLKIVSATRNFNAQKRIWEAKWNGERLVDGGENLSLTTPDPKERALKILKWSSMPGSSRHHWGTDIDINDLENEYFESGYGAKVYAWLTENASKYGYCQPYTPKNEKRPNGYNEEKWHWSYLPIAKPLSTFAKRSLNNDMIVGFDGSEAAKEIDILNNFILGINSACL